MAATAADDPLAVRLLYSPQEPTEKQHAALLCDDLGVLELFYGGAGGGGKSSLLLMAALRYVDVPSYAAIIFRRTFADLNLPGALIPRSREWLAGTDARWVERDFRWTFPSGATLSFAYLATSADKYRYASAEFQFIGFDELTGFPSEDDYSFLFTRLRKPSGVDDDHPLAQVPLRMRGAGNPGGPGHDWVLRRLVERKPKPRADDEPPDPFDTEERAKARVYIPARLEDNRHVDAESYEESLANVDAVTRAQILDGDWYARQPGDWVFDHEHINAALELGRRLDEELAAGTAPPPAGELLGTGLDWGENSGIALGWPLERGGLYVPVSRTVTGAEPGETTDEAIALLERLVELGRRRPAARRPAPLPPKGDALALVDTHRYDAAGVQSMRTYMKTVRRRQPRAKSLAVSFGAPAPQSGGAVKPTSYKSETIGYLRRLLERAFVDVAHNGDVDAYVNERFAHEDERRRRGRIKRLERSGVLALSPRTDRAGPPHNAELVRQARKTAWADRDQGKIAKGDDHELDALIALTAPLAVQHRG